MCFNTFFTAVFQNNPNNVSLFVPSDNFEINLGSFHAFGLDGADVYSWGRGTFCHYPIYLLDLATFGQTALGTRNLVTVPTRVNVQKYFNNERIEQTAIGFYHSAFLTRKHNIYVCGSNGMIICNVFKKTLLIVISKWTNRFQFLH